MNAVVILLVGLVILIAAYLTYGKWLAKQWGIDPSRSTPAHEMEDGKDYVPAKAPVLLGHHFSSIAGAGRSTDRFRQPYSAGFPYYYGFSSAVSSSVQYMTSVHCSHLSEIKDSLSVKLSQQVLAPEQRDYFLFSLTLL